LRSLKIAKSYLYQASERFEDAKRAFSRGNYPYATRLAQEGVELSLKAVLRLVGIEYPKVHDVGRVLKRFPERFQGWTSEDLHFIEETSRILASLRALSMYGGETEEIAPDEIIGKNEGEMALKRAEKTIEMCKEMTESILAKESTQ